MGERALHWLDKYLAEARPLLLGAAKRVLQLVFITQWGRAVHPNQLSSQVRRLMNQAGITKVGSCHLFRHTAASLMLDAGADIRHLQAILGHESLCTTQIYTHVPIGKLCQVHERTHPGGLFRAPRAAEASASIFALVRRQLGRLARHLLRWLERRLHGSSQT